MCIRDRATVDGYSSSTRLKLTIEKLLIKSEPNIGKVRAKQDEKLIRYYPSFIVAKKLQIHPLFLSRITSKFMVGGLNDRLINFGLEIKFESRHEKVLGYARRNVRGWEFSEMTMALLSEYKKNFPDLFQKLSTAGRDVPSISKLYPGKDINELKKLIEDVRSWLKAVRQNFVTVSLESESLTKASMAAVEEFIEKYSISPADVSKKQLAKVPREAVLDPEAAFSLLRTQKFDLGDRVIYIQNSGKVPVSYTHLIPRPRL